MGRPDNMKRRPRPEDTASIRTRNRATRSAFFSISYLLLVTTFKLTCSYCQAFVHLGTTKTTADPFKSKQKRQQAQHGFQLQHALIPEENPEFDPLSTSISGVRYTSVLSGLNQIYPPETLEQRNALSRSDGYWPFIQKGQDPPQQFTYGEFDFYFFAQLLDLAHEYYNRGREDDHIDDDRCRDWKDKVFVDIGSGTGRLVLSAATLHPNWRICRGIELLEKIHLAAQDNLSYCRQEDDTLAMMTAPTAIDDETSTVTTSTQEAISLPMAPVEFTCGSFEDPYVFFGDADLIFVFSSCMSQGIMVNLAKAIGRQCKPGTIVVTTEFMLPLEGYVEPYPDDDRVPSGSYKLELANRLDGWCWLTGGASTAYVHRVKESLWHPDLGPLSPPEVSVEDKAFQVAKALEAGELTDSKQFLRGVYNNMVFHNIPESFRPNTEDLQ